MPDSAQGNSSLLINRHDIIGMMIAVAMELTRSSLDRGFVGELVGRHLPLSPSTSQVYAGQIKDMDLAGALINQEVRDLEYLIQGYHFWTVDIQALTLRIFKEATHQRLMTQERTWDQVAQGRGQLYQ